MSRRARAAEYDDDWLSVHQVAAWLGRPVTTILRWAENGELRHTGHGRKMRFRRSDVRQWIEDNARAHVVPLRPVPHGGSRTVTPSMQIGSETHCWCGDTLGHDWQGKAIGAPHPHDHQPQQPTTPTVVIREREVDMNDIQKLARAVNDPEEHPEKPPKRGPVEPYVHTDGSTSVFVTDGVEVWCAPCHGKDSAYRTPVDTVTGLGGHIRMHHRPTETMRDDAAKAKMVDSRRYNRLREQVVAVMELLAESVGDDGLGGRVKDLEARLDKAEERAVKAEAKAAAAEGKLADLRKIIGG